MIKHIFQVLLITLTLKGMGQADIGWFNSGSEVYIENTDTIYVKGNPTSAHVVHKNFALCDNNGGIELEGNWLDSNTIPTFWDQNEGRVTMSGDYQMIAGTNVTEFYNLTLEHVSLKEMFLDVNVHNQLDLGRSELGLNQNIMHVLNPNPASITWTSNQGFVSGDSVGGYLARSTDRLETYSFPVGSLNLTNTYRAVELTPMSGNPSVFGVRLAGKDPNIEDMETSATGSTGPFSSSSLGPNLYGINDQFYHHIHRFSGTSEVDAKVYYFSSDEIFPYEFNTMAVWDNPTPQWEKDDFSVEFDIGKPEIGFPERHMQKTISNFGNDVYVLSVRDKITARVPQIFSPNKDGINDILYVLGTEIEELEFVIYNRWGEKVFETKDQNIGWDGKFRGSDAQPGVYVYYIKAGLVDNQILEQSGDVTLVR